MIDGLKLQISSDELKALSMSRADYHSKKSQWFEGKAKELGPELGEMNDRAPDIQKYSSNNRAGVLEELETKARHHKDRSTYFRFMAEHVVPNETYSLAKEDLSQLEVIGRW